jgi:hypothetical protein
MSRPPLAGGLLAAGLLVGGLLVGGLLAACLLVGGWPAGGWSAGGLPAHGAGHPQGVALLYTDSSHNFCAGFVYSRATPCGWPARRWPARAPLACWRLYSLRAYTLDTLEGTRPGICRLIGTERGQHGARKFLPTGLAEEAALIVIVSANSCQLLFGWLATPLTEAAARSKINRDRPMKFVLGHKVFSYFMLVGCHRSVSSFVQLSWLWHALSTSYLRVDTTDPVVSGTGESTWNCLLYLSFEAGEETLLHFPCSGKRLYLRYNRYLYYSTLFIRVLVLKTPGSRGRNWR